MVLFFPLRRKCIGQCERKVRTAKRSSALLSLTDLKNRTGLDYEPLKPGIYNVLSREVDRNLPKLENLKLESADTPTRLVHKALEKVHEETLNKIKNIALKRIANEQLSDILNEGLRGAPSHLNGTTLPDSKT